MDEFRFKRLEDPTSFGPGEIPGTGIVEYWFPIREGLTVKLFLPRDLKTVEVARLRKFLDALVTENDGQS